MAVTTHILKIGRLDAVVKFTGSAGATFALTSLLKSDETLGTPNVSIHSLAWTCASTSDKITVSRNSVVLYNLVGSGRFDHLKFTDATSSASDIVIDMGTNGTLILEVRKLSGYTEPDQQHPAA